MQRGNGSLDGRVEEIVVEGEKKSFKSKIPKFKKKKRNQKYQSLKRKNQNNLFLFF